jgi:hypothetical protein
LGFAGGGGVVEGFGGAVGFAGFEEEAAFDALGESGEAGFAIGVGADFEVELAGVHESIGDVDSDFGGVDWGAGFVVDGEVGGTGLDGACGRGDGFGVGGGSLREGGES